MTKTLGAWKLLQWSPGASLAVLLLYIGSVVWFEARLAYNQPQNQSTLVIATFNADGERHERVLRLEQIDGNNYVAANHWPRAWYHQALDNPEVEVKMPRAEAFAPYIAVPVVGAEEQMLRQEYAVSFNFRFRTGFPPRYFLRLDALRETWIGSD